MHGALRSQAIKANDVDNARKMIRQYSPFHEPTGNTVPTFLAMTPERLERGYFEAASWTAAARPPDFVRLNFNRLMKEGILEVGFRQTSCPRCDHAVGCNRWLVPERSTTPSLDFSFPRLCLSDEAQQSATLAGDGRLSLYYLAYCSCW